MAFSRRFPTTQLAFSIALACANATEGRCVDVTAAGKLIAIAAAEVKLSAHPHLKAQLLAILDSDNFPSHIKKLVMDSLASSAINYKTLTDEVRAARGIDPRSNSTAATANNKFRTHGGNNANLRASLAFNPDSPPEDFATLTIIGSNTLRPIDPSQSSHTDIFLKDDAEGSDGRSDVTIFIHELAHIKFAAFLERHLPRLHQHYPELIRIDPDGFFSINHDFFTLLGERFAHQTEFTALKGLNKSFRIEHWPLRFGGEARREDFLAADVRDLNRRISDWVLTRYEIIEPQFQVFSAHSLAEIFQGQVIISP